MVYKVEALAREANKDAWKFEFDGDVYSLPPDFDMLAAAKLTGGDILGGLQLLLGPDQWKRLEASPKVFGIKAMIELLQAYCTDIGVDLGEFVAPSRQSRRAAAPSKRTSNGSTGSTSPTSSRARRG
jgi:hypothetical protein